MTDSDHKTGTDPETLPEERGTDERSDLEQIVAARSDAVERGEPGGPAVKRAALVGPGLRRRVRQPRVEPVVTKPGGGIRVPFGPVVQVVLGQPGELSIGFAHRTPFKSCGR